MFWNCEWENGVCLNAETQILSNMLTEWHNLARTYWNFTW